MRKKTIKTLALDTSSKKTGWALFINGEYAQSGVIDLHKNKDSDDRVKQMCLQIRDLIKTMKPTRVVIEEMPSTQNAVTTRMLSKIIGSVFYHCITANIPYTELSCTKWRGVFGIDKRNRAEAKELSIARVKKEYDKDTSDDEADAINICEAYCINNKNAQNTHN